MPWYPEPTSTVRPPRDPSVFDSYFDRVLRTLSEWTGGYDPADSMMGTVGPMPVVGPVMMAARGGQKLMQQELFPMLERAQEAVRKLPGIRAFHGSPHDFDRFDLSKIGSGEGSQVYGHGLYFAENPATAQSYRDKLGGILPAGWMAKYPEGSTRGYIQGVIGDLAFHPEANLTPERAAKMVYNANASMRDYPLDQLARELAEGADLAKGRMYEVNIDARPEDFLNVDRQMIAQSRATQARTQGLSSTVQLYDGMPVAGNGKLRIDTHVDGSASYYLDMGGNKGRFRLTPKEVENLIGSNKSGAALYSELTNTLGSAAKASEHLRERGVAGLRYLDQGSRPRVALQPPMKTRYGWEVVNANGQLMGKGQTAAAAQKQAMEAAEKLATHNYVVFDDKLISIVRKYMLAGLGFEEAVRRAQGERQQTK